MIAALVTWLSTSKVAAKRLMLEIVTHIWRHLTLAVTAKELPCLRSLTFGKQPSASQGCHSLMTQSLLISDT
jgi:hypothetical protein